MLSGSWILAIGMGIRCFVPSEPGSKWIFLIHLGHILIGAVGPLALISPPRLSSVWFPPKQRTFATAMMVMAQSVGTALAFIIIPYLTRHYSIHTMLYVQAELGLCAALLATIYFPPRPPTPPSQSATVDRSKFWSSLKPLLCNRSFIVLAISGGLIAGGNRWVGKVLYQCVFDTKPAVPHKSTTLFKTYRCRNHGGGRIFAYAKCSKGLLEYIDHE